MQCFHGMRPPRVFRCVLVALAAVAPSSHCFRAASQAASTSQQKHLLTHPATLHPRSRSCGPRRAISQVSIAESDALDLELLLGQWAGWECRFSGSSGRPAPVDAADLPPSFAEWGVQLWGYEAYCTCKRGPPLALQETRILPAEACGVEQLATEKQTREFATPVGGTGAALLQWESQGLRIVVDAIAGAAAIEDAPSRWRVRSQLQRKEDGGVAHVQTRLWRERRVDSEPWSSEMEANRLDGRSVTQAVAAKCFVDDRIAEEGRGGSVDEDEARIVDCAGFFSIRRLRDAAGEREDFALTFSDGARRTSLHVQLDGRGALEDVKLAHKDGGQN